MKSNTAKRVLRDTFRARLGLLFFSGFVVLLFALFWALSNEELMSTLGLKSFAPNTEISESPEKIQFDKPEQPLPPTGTVKRFTDSSPVKSLIVNAPSNTHCLVNLRDARTNTLVLNLFVQKGTMAKIKVPLGTYKFNYALGDTWYGYGLGLRFGPETSYHGANSEQRFDDLLAWKRITLRAVRHCNFPTHRIPASEF